MKKGINLMAVTVICIALVVTGCGGGESKAYDYDLSKYVELGQYLGLMITEFDTEVTDGEVMAEIKSRIEMSGWYDKLAEEFTEGVVESGDIVNIDFIGTKDGEPFQGGSSEESFPLLIGSGQFIPGFEEGLIGKNIGDTVVLELTFPEHYQTADLAGQDVEFEVTIHHVTKLVLSLEFVRENSEFQTIEAYKEYIAADLKAAKEAYAVSKRQNDLLEQVFMNSVVLDYPRRELNNQVNEIKKSEQSYARSINMTWNDYLEQNFQMTQKQFDDYVLSYIKRQMDFEMVIRAIAHKEGIELTSEEEYEEIKLMYLAEMEFESEEAFMEQSEGKTLEEAMGRDNIELFFMFTKVMELVDRSAVVMRS